MVHSLLGSVPPLTHRSVRIDHGHAAGAAGAAGAAAILQEAPDGEGRVCAGPAALEGLPGSYPSRGRQADAHFEDGKVIDEDLQSHLEDRISDGIEAIREENPDDPYMVVTH